MQNVRINHVEVEPVSNIDKACADEPESVLPETR